MNDLTRRIETLEGQTRRDDLGPLLESLAAQTGISAGEIRAEAERVLMATEGQSRAEVLAWIAADCGMTVDDLAAEADVLLAASGEGSDR